MTLALLCTAQHVSDFNTPIFRSLRLLVALCRLTWGVLVLCSGIVCWWCGIRVQDDARSNTHKIHVYVLLCICVVTYKPRYMFRKVYIIPNEFLQADSIIVCTVRWQSSYIKGNISVEKQKKVFITRQQPIPENRLSWSTLRWDAT